MLDPLGVPDSLWWAEPGPAFPGFDGELDADLVGVVVHLPKSLDEILPILSALCANPPSKMPTKPGSSL